MRNPLRHLGESRALALLDQAIVSGASFVATVVVARFGGANDLGSYSIATSILLLLVGAQNAIVILPYVVQRRRHAEASDAHAGSTIAINLGLAVVACLLIAIAAAILAFTTNGHATWLAVSLAFAGPCVVAREFARRYSFAHLRMVRAMQVDTVTTVLQLGGLVALGVSGLLSAPTAIAAFGVACLVSAAGWFARTRREFHFRPQRLGEDIRQSWSLGRWLFANQLISDLAGYAPIWLSTIILGTSATGIFAACVSVVAIANPLIFGLDNVLTPRLSAAFAHGGGRELLKEAFRNTGLIGLLMACVYAAVWLGGDSLMHVFYPGGEFKGGYDEVLIVLALSTAALALTLPATSALTVIEKPRDIVIAGVITVAITIIAAVVLMQQVGLVGIALATLIGNLSCLGCRWVLLLTELARADTRRIADADAAARLSKA